MGGKHSFARGRRHSPHRRRVFSVSEEWCGPTCPAANDYNAGRGSRSREQPFIGRPLAHDGTASATQATYFPALVGADRSTRISA